MMYSSRRAVCMDITARSLLSKMSSFQTPLKTNILLGEFSKSSFTERLHSLAAKPAAGSSCLQQGESIYFPEGRSDTEAIQSQFF